MVGAAPWLKGSWTPESVDQAVCGMQRIAFHITSLRFVLCVIVAFLHDVNRRKVQVTTR